MVTRRQLLWNSAATGGLALPVLAWAANGPGANLSLQPVIEYLGDVQGIASRLGYGDEFLRPALQRQALLVLSIGYVEVFGTSVEAPVWVPHIPFYLPWGSPNPDDNYYFVPIEARGRYRLYGTRGTAPIATVTTRTGGAHIGQINGRTLSEIDLHSVPRARRGGFEFMLSAERPPGHQGAWYPLPPGTTSLLFRSRTTRAGQEDAECGIERLDTGPAPAFLDAAAADHKLKMLVSYARRQLEFLLGYLNAVRGRGGAERFVVEDQSAYGALVKQQYQMHLFELPPGEALLIESEVPERVTYWSVQLYDAFLSGIDNIARRSAANHEQLRIDGDRRVRIVVAAEDPGVPNWLDTGGWPHAGLMWRWNDANRYPIPTLRRLPLAEVMAAMPAGTPRFDTARRRAQLRAHAAYARRRGR